MRSEPCAFLSLFSLFAFILQILTRVSKGWFTLRHKHKHKHKHKHNKCSHLLHKHKKIDIRKRNELQNEVAGVLDELRFQNGGRRRNSPAAIAAPLTKETTRTKTCKQKEVLLGERYFPKEKRTRRGRG